jgi:hypothetical protein
MRTEKKMEWRTIVGLVDSQVLGKIDIDNREGWIAGHKVIEEILRALETWYSLVYPKLVYETFCDLVLKQEIGRDYIECRVPILQITKLPIVSIIREGTPNLWECWNNIAIRYTCAAVAHKLEQEEVIAIIMGIGERGGLEIQDMTFGGEDLTNTIQSVKQIITAMNSKLTYQSVTSSCKACKYVGRCRG